MKCEGAEESWTCGLHGEQPQMAYAWMEPKRLSPVLVHRQQPGWQRGVKTRLQSPPLGKGLHKCDSLGYTEKPGQDSGGRGGRNRGLKGGKERGKGKTAPFIHCPLNSSGDPWWPVTNLATLSSMFLEEPSPKEALFLFCTLDSTLVHSTTTYWWAKKMILCFHGVSLGGSKIPEI